MSVAPGTSASERVEPRADPRPADGELLVRGWQVGVCGTDREVVAGRHGRPPDGAERIVLGHESLGWVVSAPTGSGFRAGDLVTGMVRRPDPEPCAACAAGECDLCDNGRYTSCGITGRDGYGAQRWCVPAAFAVRVDPRLGALGVLTEPTSVLVKAWERIDRVRATTGSDTALISGAGAMGLLAAMLAVARGYRTFVLARRWSAGRRELVRRTGATPVDPDGTAAACAPAVVLDTTGSADVVNRLAGSAARNAVVCLIGLTDAAADRPSLAPLLGRLVATNGLLFGTVNAAPRHYAGAVAALVAADRAWLAALITRRVPLASWPQALQRRPDDVKVVVDLTATA